MAFWEIIFIHILLNFLISLSSGTPSFSRMPEEKSALTGGDVTFHCTVDGLEDRHVVQWKRGGTIITNNSEVLTDPDKIRVITDPSMGLYNLQISNVKQSDDLDYKCVVYDQNDNTEVLESNPVRLEVHTVPDQKYPDCDPLEEPLFVEGDELTILCKSQRANPPVLLQWYKGGENIQGASLNDEPAGYRTLSYTFTINYKDDGAIFQCKMTTSAIESFEKSCSLGPLVIVYKPRVQLSLPEEPIQDGMQIQLDCDDDAKPEAFQYEWYSSIPLSDDQMTLVRNRRVMLLTVSASLNGTTISCNATNIYGSGMSNTVTLFVQPKQDTSTEDTGSDDKTKLTPSTDINKVKPGEPGMGSVSSPSPGLSSRLLLLIIGILSLMLIVLLLVLIFYTCRSYQTNGNHSIIYGAPSSVCNGTNIDRAWDQTSVYFEPRDQISVHEAPTWIRTPKPPQWRRNVAVQVPFQEDPPYAEIEQDWDDGVYTLQI